MPERVQHFCDKARRCALTADMLDIAGAAGFARGAEQEASGQHDTCTTTFRSASLCAMPYMLSRGFKSIADVMLCAAALFSQASLRHVQPSRVSDMYCGLHSSTALTSTQNAHHFQHTPKLTVYLEAGTARPLNNKHCGAGLHKAIILNPVCCALQGH